jgi:hypothetical protein
MLGLKVIRLFRQLHSMNWGVSYVNASGPVIALSVGSQSERVSYLRHQ